MSNRDWYDDSADPKWWDGLIYEHRFNNRTVYLVYAELNKENFLGRRITFDGALDLLDDHRKHI